MKNKVQVSFRLKKEILFALFTVALQLPLTSMAQDQPVDGSNKMVVFKATELKVKLQGNNWQFAFPRIQFRSALKITNSSGAVVKAVMVDEGLETTSISLSNLPKGIYQCVLENRTQRFAARVMVR